MWEGSASRRQIILECSCFFVFLVAKAKKISLRSVVKLRKKNINKIIQNLGNQGI